MLDFDIVFGFFDKFTFKYQMRGHLIKLYRIMQVSSMEFLMLNLPFIVAKQIAVWVVFIHTYIFSCTPFRVRLKKLSTLQGFLQ